MIEYNKQVTRLDSLKTKYGNNDGVRVHFMDGSLTEADLVVVADGISSVGSLVLRSWSIERAPCDRHGCIRKRLKIDLTETSKTVHSQ